jgi:sRNA-binding carbon storage regulator CsrA
MEEGMLVLSRLPGEKVMLGGGSQATELTIVSVRTDRVKVRIETWMKVSDVLPLDDVTDVKLCSIDRNKARLGFESPKDVKIVRKELLSADDPTIVAVQEQVPDT